MAREVRSQPEVISFDVGIKSDAPGGSADFVDMVNLLPPRDGSAGVEPRHPILKEADFPSGGGLFHVLPIPDEDATGTPILYQGILALISNSGAPVAMFPYYDVTRTLPGEWENTFHEYSKPGDDPGPDPGPDPEPVDCMNPDLPFTVIPPHSSMTTIPIPAGTTWAIVKVMPVTAGGHSSAQTSVQLRDSVTTWVSNMSIFTNPTTMYISPEMPTVHDGIRADELRIATGPSPVGYYFVVED